MIGKAPLAHVQLVGRNAQIQKRAIQRPFNKRLCIVKIAANGIKLFAIFGEARSRGGNRLRVAIDAYHAAAARQNLAGMPAAAQGAVQIQAAGRNA